MRQTDDIDPLGPTAREYQLDGWIELRALWFRLLEDLNPDDEAGRARIMLGIAKCEERIAVLDLIVRSDNALRRVLG